MLLKVDLLVYAVPGFILLGIAETIFLIKHHRFNNGVKDIPVSFVIGVGFIVISFFFKTALLLLYQLVYSFRIHTMPNSGVLVWILCFTAEDFSYYWFHRISHKVRVLWASHSVHHTSELYSLSSAAIRQSWTGNLSGTFLFWIWMPFVGFDPGMVILVKSFSLIYQFCIHTETIKKLPAWYEAIFNTPSHHRVHHGSDVMYLDTNYGGSLIIWDRLFGTFQNEDVKPNYGLTTKINSLDPLVIVFSEWIHMINDLRSSNSLADFFKYLFFAPGWRKDGSTKTTRQMQSQSSP